MTLRYINHFNHLLDDLEQRSLKRTLKICDSASAPTMKIDGQEMLTFCSNDYLGLANHPELAKAITEGLQRFGSGSGASHMISGHHRPHDELEKALAKTQAAFIPEVRALFFSTGYMANLAAITAISSSLGSNQVMSIYSEELNHASLIDGVRLASKQNQAMIQVFPHQDLSALEQLLAKDSNQFKLIVTDGVFSMDGDLAKVAELLKLAHQYDALILIDDAHGFGVIGQHGAGILEHAGIQHTNEATGRIIYIGTLGKAAGISGAFIAGHKTLIEWILQKGRSYIYTTASPPAIAHGLLKSLELMSDDSYRTSLNKNIQHWKKTLRLNKWSLMPSETAIQPIMIGKNEDALRVAQQLYQKNIWVPAIRPPTVPADTARLRITFSASHTTEQINQLIQALMEIEHEL
jgi:8-amino-7-oxononanoate synthase